MMPWTSSVPKVHAAANTGCTVTPNSTPVANTSSITT